LIYSYLLEIFALELGDQGLQTVIISFNSDGLEDGLDILLGWGGVSTEGEEEVSCEVFHFEFYGGVVSYSVLGIADFDVDRRPVKI
jgi:hypothetical protein